MSDHIANVRDGTKIFSEINTADATDAKGHKKSLRPFYPSCLQETRRITHQQFITWLERY